MKNCTLFTRSTFVFISIQIGRFLMKIVDYRRIPATAPLPGVTKRVLIDEGTAVFIPPGENHCLINQGGNVPRFICRIPTGVE
jgi:mannose-6-phosphate isomerase-like protein (cupin superfamily)